jgi:hypothetical protein
VRRSPPAVASPDPPPFFLESLAVQLANSARRTAHSLAAVSVLLACSATAASAQAAVVTRDSITLTPGPQFSTTSWIRWLGTPMFGSRYRELWRAPITLPLLDLAVTAGGLAVSGRGAGMDAGLIYLAGADGSHWTFYPLDRPEPHSFPAGVVPEAVGDGLVTDLVS